MAVTIAQKKLLHIVLLGKKNETSSKLNKTPPMGAPKATATPAAEAADRISRFLPSFLAYFVKMRVVMFPTQQAICTSGPSLPRLIPDDTERI